MMSFEYSYMEEQPSMGRRKEEGEREKKLATISYWRGENTIHAVVSFRTTTA